MEKYYLQQNVQIEPLYNQWYCWIHLLPPATAAMNLLQRHLPILESYLDSPEAHAQAVLDPAMKGGPFVNLPGDHVAEVATLLEKTREENQLQLAFAGAILELDQWLQATATGYALEPLYRRVPELLRGYVELYYDLHHRPSFRFFEPLLYRSPFFREASQSIALSLVEKDRNRPFILSTPRLDGPDVVHLNLPFSHTGLDALFRMKQEPQTLAYIRDQLGVEISNEALFAQFFTPNPPRPYRAYTGDSFRIRYFGHACILLESKHLSILLDPVLSYTYEADVPRYTYEDLPDQIDYVLITHSHQDHILLETMLQLRHKVRHVVIGRSFDGVLQDPSLKLALQQIGFTSILELRELEEIAIPGGSITGIPFLGEHHDLFINSKLCYLIRIDGRSVMAVADSCNVEPRLYEHIHELVGDVDVLFVGMECDGAPVSWVYGPLYDQVPHRELDFSRRGRGCNFREAYDLVRRFRSKEVYVYAMGLEPWLKHILDVEYTEESNPILQSRRMIEVCKREGILAELLFGEKEILTPATLSQSF